MPRSDARDGPPKHWFSHTPRQGVFRFLFLLTPYRGRIVTLMLIRAAVMGLGMLPPLLTKVMVDNVVALEDWALFWRTAGNMTIVLGLSLALMMAATYLSMYLEQMLGLRLRRTLQSKWQKLPITYFQRWGTGEHLFRLSTDVQNVITALLKVLPDLVLLHLEFIAFLVIASRLNLRLTTYYISAFPVSVGLQLIRARKTRPLQAEQQRRYGLVGNIVSQYVAGIVTTKVFLREKYLSQRYVGQLIAVLRLTFSKWQIDRLYLSLGWLCNSLWAWVIIFYGFTLVMKGELTLGSLIALKLYLASLGRPLEELAGLVQSTMVGSVSAERLQQTLLGEEECDGSSAPISICTTRQDANAIEFDGVTFGYEPGLAVFRSATARFPARQLIGVTGPSGAGKSTLVSLIARFYQPWSGRVLLNGQDVREGNLRGVRSCLSIAPQEAMLIDGTIRENLTYGNTEATFDEVIGAAIAADAHEFIASLHYGYDTVVSSQHGALSAGQRQRIGLARAFLKRSPVLILDEGLNSLDGACRLRVLASLRAMNERTIVLITHDPEALQYCDTTFVILNGQIHELSGSPSDSDQTVFRNYLDLTIRFGVPHGESMDRRDA